MASHDFDLAVIGGGAAGLTAAAGAAQLGAKTLIVEREPALGGDCLHYGCVPSKTLIHTARVRRLMAQARRLGLPGADLPDVDFSRVRQRIQDVIDTIQHHDSEERFCSLGAKVVFGAARFTDEHSVAVGGKTYSARTLLVAAGAHAALPDIPGLAEAGALTNRELFSLDELPASLIILGGGPLALEMAQAFQRLGTQVTVVQRSAQVLSGEDPDMAGIVAEALRDEGVEVLVNAKVAAVRKEGASVAVDLVLDGRRQRTLLASKLLAALGRAPNVQGLDLSKAGVAHTDKGIEVDSRLRTSQRHIFAAGDVTGRHMFTHAAGYEGSVVVANAVFHLPRKTNYELMPRCTYTDPELSVLGLNETRAKAQGVEYTVWREEFAANDRAQAEGETRGMIKLLVSRRGKPLGVQIAGPRAGELLNEWVAVLGGKVRLSTLAAAAHPYPTLGEINKRVAGKMLSDKLFSGAVRKGLKFFFGFKGRACGLDPE